MKSQSRVFNLGGLGNQLFQYAFALFLNVGSNNVEVIFNPKRVRISENSKPDICQLVKDGDVSIKEGSSERFLVRKLMNLTLRLSSPQNFVPIKIVDLILRVFLEVVNKVNRRNERLTGFSNPGYIENLNLSEPKEYLAYFQSYRWASLPEIKENLKQLFLNLDSELIKSFEKQSEGTSPLVVHLRIGDYVSDSRIGILEKSYYLEAIQAMWATNLYTEIWAFSDSIDEAQNKLATVSNIPIRWIAPEMAKPVELLGIMTLGKGFILSNSTFGWWGAFLSRTENANVVVPNKWFKGIRDPIDLCPDTWIRSKAFFE
jgi:hypothetical protein